MSELVRTDHGLSFKPSSMDLREVDSFMNTEAPRIHDSFGGLSVQEDGYLVIPDHYKKLQPAIQSYVGKVGSLEHQTTREEWEALYDDLSAAEAKASKSDNGPLEVFNKMILKVGENSDAVDPWINLIPNSYGLCVVKAGFAILLKMAKKHSETRQAIFDAFIDVRGTIADAMSRGIHFQSHHSVYRRAGELYGSIVDAIQDLLAIVEYRKEKRSLGRRISRGKAPLRDPKEILKTVKDTADGFLKEVDNCRDAIIQKTGRDTQQTRGKVEFVCWKAIEIRDSVSRVQKGQDEQLSILKNVQQEQDVVGLRLSQCREQSTEGMREILRDQEKKYQATITKLEWIIRQQLPVGPDAYIPPVRHEGASKAVISLKRLVTILSSSFAGPAADYGTELDFDISQMRNNDLQAVMSSAATFHPVSQSQAHSALDHDRLFEWLHTDHPDFLFIDGNCQGNPTDSVSPMSLLCTRVGLTIANMEPENVFVHFYCGLHVDTRRNNWYGPDGMIRSILSQILTALVDKELLDMGFLNSRSFVKDLEYHDVHTLCDLLHDLVQQFDTDTTIYCFVDGVSKFDVDFRGAFASLKLILRRIQGITRDDNLKPKLKVLMTVPFRSSQRLRRTIEDECYISLSPHALGSKQLSQASVKSTTMNMWSNYQV
ncbi:hypothetical protein FPOA_11715 [Fusarium poae]|uniref:Fungal STAND N-terminal Goodbye domain-containing protein n=1 Tax=Fusarium poae TaxID=36050 RepID=A0A1B8AHL7_FUSPO|nr:hypothetical protein FPOA_11715 [Fusarium poae]